MLDRAASRLAEFSGRPLRGYSTFDFGRDRDSGARSVIVAKDVAEGLLERIRAQLPEGVIAFIGTTKWLGDERHGGVELVVANGHSQFDILRVARSDAINYGMETEDLVAKLMEYDEAYGIDIFQAETDTIQFTLRRPPGSLSPFCSDLYEFCPDIVDQGCATVEALEEEIAASAGRVFLWWD